MEIDVAIILNLKACSFKTTPNTSTGFQNLLIL